jgi:predicted RND superfamily exporter protein
VKKLEDFIVRYAWPIFIVTIVITIIFGIQFRNIRFEDDFTKYVPESDAHNDDCFGIGLWGSLHESLL